MGSVTPRLPVELFDYEYPEELIAAQPAEPRDSSRLLVLDRATARREHRIFRDLPSFLQPGDCLVLNRTRVFSCRLLGRKESGGKVDLLLSRELAPGLWCALSSGLKPGKRLVFPADLTASVERLNEEGEYVLRFSRTDVANYLLEHGLAPLPPYIAKRKTATRADNERYQTVFAKDPGSIAAPTAGLHFTEGLLKRLQDGGVGVAYVTLHVGRGTFKPIQADDAAAHEMLPEWFRLEADQAALICAAKARGKRVISVGTTSTRTLETLAARAEGFGPGEGWSSLYIYPGYQWKLIDALITNFHLPRSTPLMLAAAFAGREALLEAYREAVTLRYRLYSYGDAMLVT